MKTKHIICTAFAFALAAMPVFAQEIEVIQYVDENGGLVDLVTFEGGTQGSLINPDNGGLIEGTASGMRFASPWRTLTSGAYSNTPSPPTVAYFPTFVEVPYAEVTFSTSVGKVGFYYAAFMPVTLEAFNEAGDIVASSIGEPNFPGGNFSVWDFLSVETEENVITRVRITSMPNATILDDFSTTIVVPSTDSDGDGIPDDEDACPNSDMSATIVIFGTDTEVANELLEDGCTLADLIVAALTEEPGNADVVAVLVDLKADGLITGREMGTILKEINSP